MRTEQQLLMERPATTRPKAPGIHTILLHILDDEFHDQRIEIGLALSRACSAHLSCIHVTPMEAYVASDAFGGIFVMNDVMRALLDLSVPLQGIQIRSRNLEDLFLKLTGKGFDA